MATYIITFLGLNPRPMKYEFEGETYSAQVFPEALMNFVSFDRMFVCVTKKAKEETYPILKRLGDKRIEPIDFADGETTKQMWQNFTEIVNRFQPGDKVIFDITHAARSIPFLTFLFSAYLKVAKDVEILNVYYGAPVFSNSPPPPSSARDESKTLIAVNPAPAPVIQLGEFVSMLDWMSATQRFVDLGDGNGLVKLLQGLTIADASLRELVEQMAGAIEMVSDALIYIRPIEVMSAAAQLHALIPQLNVASQDLPELQPFLLLSEQIDKKYESLALVDPLKDFNLFDNLSCQLSIINWYQEHQQQIKSIVLARELFISILAYWLQQDPFDYDFRNYCPAILRSPELEPAFNDFADKTMLLKVWKQIKNPRNEYAHVGCTRSYKPIQELKADIDRTINQSKDCLQWFLDSARTRQGERKQNQAIARPILKPRKRQ
jgi:CRISPR-associated (Cas) DxTHG family